MFSEFSNYYTGGVAKELYSFHTFIFKSGIMTTEYAFYLYFYFIELLQLAIVQLVWGKEEHSEIDKGSQVIGY